MTPADKLKRAQAAAKRTALEDALALALRSHKLDAGMVRQHKPFADVGYAYDFGWPYSVPPVLVEVQGGIWSGGAHVRPKGVLRDMDKANRAALAGWCLLQVSADDIKSGRAVEMIGRALGDNVRAKPPSAAQEKQR